MSDNLAGAPSSDELDGLWARHHAEWRDTAQVASQWEAAAQVDERLLSCRTEGAWWEALARTGKTLLVTREYEHLLMGLSFNGDQPSITYMTLPHPSGLAFDARRGVVHVASTRNPNQVFDLAPVTGQMPRLDVAAGDDADGRPERPLIPVRSRFYPGCYYMHDLAMIDGVLYANSVGQNVVVRLLDGGRAERVWWPRCIETADGPVFGQNYIQLNSIAAGSQISDSYFSASAEVMSELRPGQPDFPVDKRGVIFSGATREPVVRGLTRPHSARLHRDRVWVDNSGYGELGFAEDEQLTPVAHLPGWTRGLAFHDDIAFVGTSRVIPRFRQYAPGLDLDSSVCGLHAVDIRSGTVLGSLIWQYGNQIFAIELVPKNYASGFPFTVGQERATEHEKRLFYAFSLDNASRDTTHG